MSSYIVISGFNIPTDKNNYISLNALYNLSSAAKHKAPNRWLEQETAKALVKQLSNDLNSKKGQDYDPNNNHDVIVQYKTGTDRGTYGHQLIAISYAGWISPSFQLEVNQAFLNTKILLSAEREKINVDKDSYMSLIHENLAYEKVINEYKDKLISSLTHNNELLSSYFTMTSKESDFDLDTVKLIISLHNKGLSDKEIYKIVFEKSLN
ncbi:KilA-N domain-containing protein [Pseudoalteromonas rhizosphaerae]|uniref:KilA-N domain-containing protein n=1 Tax=Pseudoalteromonas rhizosphaerae TaxID=2518973 RepID=UPI0021486A30|nr:KilA-N domain-containing protein [Pseudoalteromonas rhizosphaerae]